MLVSADGAAAPTKLSNQPPQTTTIHSFLSRRAVEQLTIDSVAIFSITKNYLKAPNRVERQEELLVGVVASVASARIFFWGHGT